MIQQDVSTDALGKVGLVEIIYVISFVLVNRFMKSNPYYLLVCILIVQLKRGIDLFPIFTYKSKSAYPLMKGRLHTSYYNATYSIKST